MKKLTAISLLLFLASIGYISAWGENKAEKGLTAMQLQTVQGVGQSLLRAKRIVPEDEEIAELREDIGKLQGLLQNIAEFDKSSLRLQAEQPQSAGSLATSKQTASHNSDAFAIQQVRELIGNMEARHQSLTPQSQQLLKAENKGLFSETYRQKTKANILKKVISIGDEFEAALDLPVAKRQLRLRQLAKSAKIIPPMQLEKSNREPAPTFVSRTSHRR